MDHQKKNKPALSDVRAPNRRERRKKRLEVVQPVVHEVIQRRSFELAAKKVFASFLFWTILIIAVGALLLLAYPRVSVYPDRVSNPGEPFQTSFAIKNDGYLPIYEVHYSLSLDNIEFGQGNTLPQAYSGINETLIPRIARGESSTISLIPFIDLLKVSFGIILPPKAVTSAELSIHVSYRSYPIPYVFTDRIRFKTHMGGSGEYVWSGYRSQK